MSTAVTQHALERYFAVLGDLGRLVEVADVQGRRMAPDDGVRRALGLARATKTTRSRVFFIGNGGSAGICSHMATDWMKNGGFSSLALNDGATLTCLGNDLGFEQVFARQLESLARRGDLLIAISSSGNSPDILRGVEAARAATADVVTLSGFGSDNKLRSEGDVNFYVPNRAYGFVEIAHLAICHAILDISMDLFPGVPDA